MKHYHSEVQGTGRRYWFKEAEEARAFAKAKREAGYPVIADEAEWASPDCGPSVWVSRSKKVSARTQLYLGGVDTASGL